MDHDVVAQMFGQRHQVEAERYVVAPRARTPLCAGGAYAHAPVLQAEASCERVEPRRQYGLGLGPESLDLLLCKLRRPYARSEAAACRLHPFCFCLEEDDGTPLGNVAAPRPKGVPRAICAVRVPCVRASRRRAWGGAVSSSCSLADHEIYDGVLDCGIALIVDIDRHVVEYHYQRIRTIYEHLGGVQIHLLL